VNYFTVSSVSAKGEKANNRLRSGKPEKIEEGKAHPLLSSFGGKIA